MEQHILPSNIVEFERSAARVFHRRWRFLLRYLNARWRSKMIARLLPLLEEAFDHPWVAKVELNFRFWPGNDTILIKLWRFYKALPSQSMHWDAPITVSVFRQRKGKRKQALCMSLYVVNDILYIAQIQGIPGTDAPKELRAWPKIFIEVCRKFARQERLLEVRIPKAETLYSYRNPFLGPDLLPKARAQTLLRIRRNMRLLYDANALDLGFFPDGNWLRWDNSNSPRERHQVADDLVSARVRFVPAALL